MSAAAQPARPQTPAPRHDPDLGRERVRDAAYRAPRTRHRAAQRSRLTRVFVVFVACLAVLAVGRVAISFAVVQKSLQTDAVVREQRRIDAKNAALQENVTKLTSTVRIRRIAESDLGLVDASHVIYLRPGQRATIAEVAASP